MSTFERIFFLLVLLLFCSHLQAQELDTIQNLCKQSLDSLTLVNEDLQTHVKKLEQQLERLEEKQKFYEEKESFYKIEMMRDLRENNEMTARLFANEFRAEVSKRMFEKFKVLK